MSGYKWDPVWRIVPRNGGETVYWMSDELTDCKGHNKITLQYAESMNIREDINRSLRPVVHGVRPEVEIECQIFTMDDQAFLANIESALLLPNHYNVFLSLDGGVTEREVVIKGVSNPTAIRGKTVLGATFTIAVRCVDLIPRRPAMMTDPLTGGELIGNGGFEDWNTGVPVGWSGSSGVGTIAQNTANPNTGLSCVQITRSDGSTYFQFNPSVSGIPGILDGKWYRLQVSYRGATAITDALKCEITRSLGSTLQYLQTDMTSWATTQAFAFVETPPGPAIWAAAETYFRGPNDSLSNVAIRPRFNGYFTGANLFLDDVSIFGPVLRPGYATW